MITLINRLANYVAKQGRIPRRIIEILKSYCWVRVMRFWIFDLTRVDAPWRKFRKQSESLIRWERATLENCRRWIQSGADGFTSWQGELMIQLIEQEHLVLVGYIDNSDNSATQVPDCYATLAFGHKPMTQHCSFYMEPNEGTIRTVYTRERLRGRGLATKIYAELCCLAKERGLTKVYVDIDSSNIPSLRAAEKAGGVRMQDVVVYHFTFRKHIYQVWAQGSLKNRFGLRK